jgi:hypothetical protein
MALLYLMLLSYHEDMDIVFILPNIFQKNTRRLITPSGFVVSDNQKKKKNNNKVQI